MVASVIQRTCAFNTLKFSDNSMYVCIRVCMHVCMHIYVYTQTCLESFKMWCLRKAEESNSINRVKNEKVLQGVKEDKNPCPTFDKRNVC